MKARWVVVASLTAVALVAGGCSSSSSGGSSGGAEFHVLDITALSGPLASIGTPETQATKAAVNYLNSLGGLSGRKIVLDVKDELWAMTAAHREKTFGKVYLTVDREARKPQEGAVAAAFRQAASVWLRKTSSSFSRLSGSSSLVSNLACRTVSYGLFRSFRPPAF